MTNYKKWTKANYFEFKTKAKFILFEKHLNMYHCLMSMAELEKFI